MISPLTGLDPVTVGVDVLPEGEEDPGVGEPWTPTISLSLGLYFQLFKSPIAIAGAVQQCIVCCHINPVIMFVLLQTCRSSCQCMKLCLDNCALLRVSL